MVLTIATGQIMLRLRQEAEQIPVEEFQRQAVVSARKIIITARGEIHNKVEHIPPEILPTAGITALTAGPIPITGVVQIPTHRLVLQGAVQMVEEHEVVRPRVPAPMVEQGVGIN
jgi:hypothetical protein